MTARGSPEAFAARKTVAGAVVIGLDDWRYGQRWLLVEGAVRRLLFTENETNYQRIFNAPNPTPYVKDAFDDFSCSGETDAVNPANTGTKSAALTQRTIPPGASVALRLRLTDQDPAANRAAPFGPEFEEIFAQRISEADEFYAHAMPAGTFRRRAQRAAAGVRRAAAGQSSSTTTTCATWLQGDPPARLRRPSASTAAITNGRTCTTPTCSRCRTSGSIRGTRRGTSRSTASPSP